MFFLLLQIEELRGFFDLEGELLLHFSPEPIDFALVAALHVLDQVIPFLVEFVDLLVPEGIEISELVFMRSVQITMLLIVPLLHLIDPPRLEILLQLLRCLSPTLRLSVVPIPLRLNHLRLSLLQRCLNLIG